MASKSRVVSAIAERITRQGLAASALQVAGAGLMALGIGLIFLPAGIIAAGVALVAFGVAAELGGGDAG